MVKPARGSWLLLALAACSMSPRIVSDFEGAVNVASGVAVRLRDLIGTAAGLIGRPDLVQYGARPANPGEPARLVADVRRLRQEIGFRPAYDLEAGLAQTIEWYTNHMT